ncbi:hypothetical protein [Methylocystis sp. ATCC 49242]|uniref:hypothetical protein n=1 Tax=Methylocystis sp. ATCC 49242 TaxID=622637 RepID=UPI0001F8783F|nr:hypothetical protein [Methylocystis sp. ATCC 49242]
MPHKIFFMHIAKTAGSYINHLFENSLGPDKVIVHGEVKIRNRENFCRLVESGVEFFSGHIYHRLWLELAKGMTDQFKMITVLRDPIDHIASHILWLDHYNLPEKKAEYERLSERPRRIVDLIGQIDLRNPGDLDHFVTHLPPAAVKLLDNCQSRYFLCGPGSIIADHEPITLRHCSAILAAIRNFDLILPQNDLDTGIAMMNGILGTNVTPRSERINEAKSPRRIDTSNPLIRSILSKRVTVDSWLWRHVTGAQKGKQGKGLAD